VQNCFLPYELLKSHFDLTCSDVNPEFNQIQIYAIINESGIWLLNYSS